MSQQVELPLLLVVEAEEEMETDEIRAELRLGQHTAKPTQAAEVAEAQTPTTDLKAVAAVA
jgi:hypothetical protein